MRQRAIKRNIRVKFKFRPKDRMNHIIVIKRENMIDRELTEREKEILEMIRPTTFHDMVDIVRRDVEISKYDAKRELRNLRNGIVNKVLNGHNTEETNEIVNGITKGIMNERTDVNIRGEICEVSV